MFCCFVVDVPSSCHIAIAFLFFCRCRFFCHVSCFVVLLFFMFCCFVVDVPSSCHIAIAFLFFWGCGFFCNFFTFFCLSCFMLCCFVVFLGLSFFVIFHIFYVCHVSCFVVLLFFMF